MVLFSISREFDLFLCHCHDPQARVHNSHTRYTFNVLTKHVVLGLSGLLGQDTRGGNLRDSY